MLKKYQNKPQTKHGVKAEKKTANRLSAKVTPASGAKSHSKGDFTKARFLFENKATKNQSMSLKYEWLAKISDEAQQAGRDAALAIQFVDTSGNPKPDGAWVLIREIDLEELLERANGSRS